MEVSRSSTLEESKFIPVEGCVVRVEDDLGAMAVYEENAPGVYTADLDEDFLGLNRAYKLFIDTPDGSRYESAYDSLLPCPEPEDLYFEVESQLNADQKVAHNGVQFYVDVKGGNNDSRNVMWRLEETYEYRSNFLIGAIWDGVVLYEWVGGTDSLYTCYRTLDIPEVHVASSRLLTDNKLTKYPLNYVSDQTPRLRFKYSLLISQHSLTDEAFRFWEQTRIQLTETGSFYETQPSTVPGNICNIHDGAEQVLGYFYASQVKEKRITSRFGFRTPLKYCERDTIMGVEELGTVYPYYMYSLSPLGSGPPYVTAQPDCFNCRLRGGTTEPPDYWYDDD